jgi:hypothetical protein
MDGGLLLYTMTASVNIIKGDINEENNFFFNYAGFSIVDSYRL